jgi:murein DD-endopeptidase MepM/ murein hydrolase activator NlpD
MPHRAIDPSHPKGLQESQPSAVSLDGDRGSELKPRGWRTARPRLAGRPWRLLSFAIAVSLATAATAQPPERPADGGGEILENRHPPMPKQQRAEAERQLRQNQPSASLYNRRSGGSNSLQNGLRLGWPLQAKSEFTHPGFHATSNLVDLDPAFPAAVLDYQCGERSYDTEDGYNHSGTDLFLWPFAWSLMDSSQIEVIAAAPGTLSCKLDGSFDRECKANGLYTESNMVCVTHDDGSRALYVHLQNGSTTPLPLGSAIEAGDYLGRVGSSGFSTGPHLHFELQDPYGNPVDPFAGPCRTGISQWDDQPAYYDSAINMLTTHDTPPDFKPEQCHEPEEPHFSDSFAPGQIFYTAVFLRDQLSTTKLTLLLRQPDGSVWREWSTSTSDAPHYAASYRYWRWTLPTEDQAPQGHWELEASLEGRTTTHSFSVPEASPHILGMLALLTLVALRRAAR